MRTRDVAKTLSQMGTLLELQGENPFRCRAYHNAAEALKGMPEDLNELVDQGRLADQSGIGKTIAEKITILVKQGHLPAFEALRAKTPPGMLAMLRVPGLGPKKIRQIHGALKVETLEDLRQAAESGALAELKGFGAKTATKILEGLQFLNQSGGRVLQSKARRLVAPILHAVVEDPDVDRAEVCGSLRRRCETIGDLDVLFASNDPKAVLDRMVQLPDVETILQHGPTKASVRLADGVQCDLRGVSATQFPFALHYFTGSKAHNIEMRRRAIARGLKLSEYGLHREDGTSLDCPDEAAIFRALGLSEIPPELREDRGEFALAERGGIPNLVRLEDLEGAYHNHTNWSDGTHTLEQMGKAARARGLKWLGIADHSKSSSYAGGLSIDSVHKQWEAIDRINREHFGDGTFQLLKGIECDILPDGTLDYPDEVLAGFDFVVASVHSSFQMDARAMTDRLITAIRSPVVTMLGHPTGRLLLTRAGYEVELDRLIAEAAETGTWLEINANPHRLDLDEFAARRAAEAGVPLVINPDAHEIDGLDDLDYGIGVARRAGLTAEQIANRHDGPCLSR